MKNLITVIFFLYYSSPIFAQVPAFWMSAETLDNSLLADQTRELEESFKNILETKQEVFQSIQHNPNRKWALQSIKTELGISAEGAIGVMGAGGEAALELIWIRKGTNNGGSSLIEETAPEAEEIQINAQMSEEAVLNEIAPIVELTMASYGVRRRHKLLKNLLTHALKFQQTIRELESAPAMSSWYPYKYQLELFVSAKGDIYFFEVGNSVRLRLEWWRIKKTNSQAVTTPYSPVELSENAKFVTGIASDLEVIADTNFENDFRLNCLKVGVGTTIEGNLFIVKGKATAIGSIFFKRDEIRPESLLFPTLLNEVTSYSMKDGANSVRIPRMSFRAGIRKGASIAGFFARHAKSNPKTPYELNVIETELNVFTGGGIGIVNVEGSAVLTLFITRNVSI